MGLSPEWKNLPRRHCDNCGTLYKQIRPRREGEHGFCKSQCRKSFHKHQGAYSKLKVDLQRMVGREMADFEKRLHQIVIEELTKYTQYSKVTSDLAPPPRIPAPR